MDDELTKFALEHRESSRKVVFFSRADKEALLAKTLRDSAQASVAAARDSRRRQRGAGGGSKVQGLAKEFSDKVRAWIWTQLSAPIPVCRSWP